MTKLYRSTMYAVLALPFAALAQAQTAPANDDTYKLDQFNVSASSVNGYGASESMTGTRVATQIKDLPFTINVLTSDFLEDFGIFQIDDSLTQIGGFTQIDIGGGFNLRGFSATSQLRDGFYRLGRYGSTNIARIEVIKGPNAGIYGRTSPGGMVNMISIAPKKEETETLTANIGSFKTTRFIAQGTGSITKNTYYIVNVAQLNRDFDVDIHHNRENQAFLAVKHDFADGSHLLVSAEYFLQYNHAPSSSAPIIFDGHGTVAVSGSSQPVGSTAIGYAKNLAKYQAFGPFSELNRGSITFLAAYDRRNTDWWSTRIGVQDFRARRWDYNQNSGWGAIAVNSSVPANNYLETRSTQVRFGEIMEDGGGVQFDNVFNYNIGSKVGAKTLATVDFNDYYRWDPTRDTLKDATYNAWAAGNGIAQGRAFAVNPGTYTPVVPSIAYYQAPFQYGQTTASGGINYPYQRATKRRTSVLGGLIRQELHFFQDRLLVYFGGRFDEARFLERDYTTPGSGHVRRFVNETRPNIGALYKVTQNPDFRIYANYSESYFVDQTASPSSIVASTFKPEIAKGFDYGIKGSFFNQQLSYTIGAYYINRYNVLVSDSLLANGTFTTVSLPDGDQLDRGVEADVTWQVTDEVSAVLSAGHVNAIYSNFGSRFPEAVGRSVQNVVPDNGSITLKYTPRSGVLKGFSANIGGTWVTKTHTESPTAGDVISTTVGTTSVPPYVSSSTNQWALTIPGYTIWNLGLHYNWRTDWHAKLEHEVSPNFNNFTDKSYLKVNKNIGDSFAMYVTYKLSFAAFGL
ncbi:MAG TPA: TonB-dependent receptor plug domain-containing protein [Opitutaceae bacterium]|nr:TonB-dependent receptor plug domain-containing protein [Opitutaceae bacterium]